jgi:hypothetical protein
MRLGLVGGQWSIPNLCHLLGKSEEFAAPNGRLLGLGQGLAAEEGSPVGRQRLCRRWLKQL